MQNWQGEGWIAECSSQFQHLEEWRRWLGPHGPGTPLPYQLALKTRTTSLTLPQYKYNTLEVDLFNTVDRGLNQIFIAAAARSVLDGWRFEIHTITSVLRHVDMDGQVQIGADAQQESEWKVKGRRVYKRLFGWWQRGVPPTWLVIVGCLVVQVGVVQHYPAHTAVFKIDCNFLLAWIWAVPSGGEGVCSQGEGESSHLQLL